MNPDRLDRFARHIVLPEVGAVGQARLAASHIVLVGMGGIHGAAQVWGVGLLIKAPLTLLTLYLMVRASGVPLAGMRSKLSGILKN